MKMLWMYRFTDGAVEARCFWASNAVSLPGCSRTAEIAAGNVSP